MTHPASILSASRASKLSSEEDASPSAFSDGSILRSVESKKDGS